MIDWTQVPCEETCKTPAQCMAALCGVVGQIGGWHPDDPPADLTRGNKRSLSRRDAARLERLVKRLFRGLGDMIYAAMDAAEGVYRCENCRQKHAANEKCDRETIKRDEHFRKIAKSKHRDTGYVEIDDDAAVNMSEDGAYVQAWLYVEDDVEDK